MGSGAACYDKPRCQLSGKKCLEGCRSEAEGTENRRASTVRILFGDGDAAFTCFELASLGLVEHPPLLRWRHGVEALSSRQGVCFEFEHLRGDSHSLMHISACSLACAGC